MHDLGSTCYYESSLMDSSNQPLLPWIGGVSSSMTLKDCYLGCLMIDMVEKETDFTIGISGGEYCFCGHAFDSTSKFMIVRCILNTNLSFKTRNITEM